MNWINFFYVKKSQNLVNILGWVNKNQILRRVKKKRRYFSVFLVKKWVKKSQNFGSKSQNFQV